MALPAGVSKLGSFKGGKGDKGDTGSVAYVEVSALPAGSAPTAQMVGPESNRGLKLGVPRGLPGTNAVANDEAFATYVGAEDTETHAALAAKLGVLNARTSGADMRKAAEESPRNIAATGHSLFYGQDTTATGTQPPVNGATQTRSATPTTDALRTQSGFLSTSAVVLVNQTYPGDRTAEAITRWASGSSGDTEFFWIDTNDANAYGSGVPLTDQQTATNMASLAARARERGAAFIVVGGMPVLATRDSWKVFASAETERTVAERLGATYIDAGELANGAATSGLYWTDGVHLVGSVYHLIGARLAAMLGPKGVNPPKVSAGRVFTWRDALWAGTGAVITQAAPNVAGRVTRLDEGETLGFSFWADTPVVPLVKLRTSGSDATVGLFTNLHIDREPVYATLQGEGAQTVAVTAQPVMSPGPAGLVIRAESGGVEVLSIEFLPVDASYLSSEVRAFSMPPVGGRGGRINSWEARIAWGSGVPLRSSPAQSDRVARRWLADLRIGANNSGLVLIPAVRTDVTHYARDGHFFLRNGADLIVRKMAAGATTDTTVTGVFAPTGYVNAVIELVYDATAGSMTVYVDNVLRHTIASYPYKFAIAGVIAGAAASGGFASGAVSIT